MGYRQTAFAVGEWYHCYTRSITGRPVFEDVRDYQRFLESLYLCNGTSAIKRGAVSRPSFEKMLTLDRGATLVDIAAYAVMPNHFHLLLLETRECGISAFMQKLGTSYSMYYNVKRAHVGNVFIKPFRAKHIDDDRYLRHVLQYIHLNPIEIFEPAWKSGVVRKRADVEKNIRLYRWSSLPFYENKRFPEGVILGKGAVDMFGKRPTLSSVIDDAIEYYGALEI